MIVFLDRKRLETALVQRARARRAMRGAPTLRVRDRQPPHEFRQVAVAARPKHEMPMIGHNAPRQNPHRQPALGLSNHFLERLEITLFPKNPHPPRCSVQHVVRISSAGNSQSSRHDGWRLPSIRRSVKNKDSRPLYSLRLLAGAHMLLPSSDTLETPVSELKRHGGRVTQEPENREGFGISLTAGPPADKDENEYAV